MAAAHRRARSLITGSDGTDPRYRRPRRDRPPPPRRPGPPAARCAPGRPAAAPRLRAARGPLRPAAAAPDRPTAGNGLAPWEPIRSPLTPAGAGAVPVISRRAVA